MKIAIRINITQVDDDIIHNLYEIYDVYEYNNKNYPNGYKNLVDSLKSKSKKLIGALSI